VEANGETDKKLSQQAGLQPWTPLEEFEDISPLAIWKKPYDLHSHPYEGKDSIVSTYLVETWPYCQRFIEDRKVYKLGPRAIDSTICDECNVYILTSLCMLRHISTAIPGKHAATGRDGLTIHGQYYVNLFEKFSHLRISLAISGWSSRNSCKITSGWIDFDHNHRY